MPILNSQRLIKEEVIEALSNRGIVYLKGRPNGKTRIHSRVVDSLGESDSTKIGRFIASKHEDNWSVLILENVSFPRRENVGINDMMRKIVMATNWVEKATTMHSYKLEIEYKKLMTELNKKRIILCIAVDNAELLPSKAFTVLKHLNELRLGGKNIGVSSLISGRYGMIPFPGSFTRHCIEIQVGRISANDEVLQMIEYNWPREVERFTPAALTALLSFDTTLEMMQAARLMIGERKSKRYTRVNEEVIDTVFQEMNIIRKAA